MSPFCPLLDMLSGRHPARLPRLAHPDHAADRRPDGLVQPPARRQRPRPPPGRGPAAGADDAGLRDRRADRQVGHDTPSASPSGPIAPPPPEGMLPGRGLALGRRWTGTFRPTASPARGRRAPLAANLGRPPPSGKPAERTTRPAGWGRVASAAGMTKRQRIEAYLDRLSPEQLQNLTVREITADLQARAWRSPSATSSRSSTSSDPHPRPRRRGSGPRRPRR